MILTGNGGTLPLSPISIFDISALCLILAYSVPPVCQTLAGPTGGRHDPCLHLRVDSLLGGSSEEVPTGSRGGPEERKPPSGGNLGAASQGMGGAWPGQRVGTGMKGPGMFGGQPSSLQLEQRVCEG